MLGSKEIIPSRSLLTPFGRVTTPAVELPPLRPPVLDQRRAGAVRHGIGIDVATFVGVIPWVGGPLSDSLRAMHTEALKRTLTSQELNSYLKYDKQYPDTVAVLRTFVKE